MFTAASWTATARKRFTFIVFIQQVYSAHRFLYIIYTPRWVSVWEIRVHDFSIVMRDRSHLNDALCSMDGPPLYRYFTCYFVDCSRARSILWSNDNNDYSTNFVYKVTRVSLQSLNFSSRLPYRYKLIDGPTIIIVQGKYIWCRL